MVPDHAKELLKPGPYAVERIEVKSRGSGLRVTKTHRRSQPRRILAELKARDPDQVTLFQLVYEEVKKQVEDEVFIFKESRTNCGSRDSESRTRQIPDDGLWLVSGSSSRMPR